MRYACIVSLLLLFTSPALAQKIEVKYDKATNFGSYKTYSWDRGMAARNPLIDQMIVEAIDNELALRGLSKKQSDGDVIVIYTAAVGADVAMAYGSRGNAGAPQQTGIAMGDTGWLVPKGALGVTFMDPKSKNLIWQGRATSSLPSAPSNDMQKDAKKAEKTVKKAVEKLFKKYPVSPTSSAH